METKHIVMIHGMWGTGAYWENYRTFFEEKGYQVHTPTLRFHQLTDEGLPHSRLGTTSVKDYCDDLENEISELDTPPICHGRS